MKRKGIWIFWEYICIEIFFCFFFIFFVFKRIGFEKMIRMAVSSDMSFYIIENRQITFLVLFYLIFLMVGLLLTVLLRILLYKKKVMKISLICLLFNIFINCLSLYMPFLIVFNVLKF